MFSLDLESVPTHRVLPRGQYEAYVGKAEFKFSKTGNEYLEACFNTLDGKNIYHNYNIFHPSEEARSIALSDLKKMLIAAGFSSGSFKFDSREKLLESVFSFRGYLLVDVKEEHPYEPKNVIKGYKKLGGESEGEALVNVPAF